MCATVYEWRHLVKAMEVTTGLVETNGSPLTSGWLSRLCECSKFNAIVFRKQAFILSISTYVFTARIIDILFSRSFIVSFLTHLVTHLVWPHQLENPPGRPRARRISP